MADAETSAASWHLKKTSNHNNFISSFHPYIETTLPFYKNCFLLKNILSNLPIDKFALLKEINKKRKLKYWNRGLNLMFVIFLILGKSVHLYAQDSLIIKADSISNSQSKIEYWKKDAYQSFPKDTLYARDTLSKQIFEKIEKKYHSPEFNYDEKKIDRLSFWQRLSRRVNQFLESLFPNWTKNTGNALLYLLIFLGIAALVFTVYRIVFSKNKIFLKEKKEVFDTQVDFIERNLESIDIDHYINQALQEKEWNLAIRYLHLANLQLLARKGLIEWDYRKTNQDFLAELKTESLKNGFQKTTDTFNYVWFGSFELDKNGFEQLRQDFIHFKNEIR